MRFRRQASLYGRMVVSAMVLLTFTIALTTVFAVLSIVGMTLAAGLGASVWVLFLALPRVSTVLPVSPGAAALVALLYLITAYRYEPQITDVLGTEYFFWPDSPLSSITTATALAAVYEVIVDGIVAIGDLVITYLGTAVPLAVGVSALIGAYFCMRAINREVRRLREFSGQSRDFIDIESDVQQRVTRLAAQLTISTPDVVVSNTSDIFAYTVGTRSEKTIIVSYGLIDTVADDELDAVLAHELGHIANGDVALMSAALAPVLVAEEIHAERKDRETHDTRSSQQSGFLHDVLGVWRRLNRLEERLIDAVIDAVTGAVLWYGQLGAGVLSRGREYAADAAAAELTGEPASLVRALRTVNGAHHRPESDLRDTDMAIEVLNIAPRPYDTRLSFDSHPPLEQRVRELQERERTQETR